MGAARHSAGARSLAVAQPASMKETWHSANIAGDGPGRGARTAVRRQDGPSASRARSSEVRLVPMFDICPSKPLIFLGRLWRFVTT